MDANHPAIRSLYEEEINAHKRHIEELRVRNNDSDQRNADLLQRINQLEDIVQKAEVANRDLSTAFEHMRQENMRLQETPRNQQVANPMMIRQQEEESTSRELEVARRQYLDLTRESVSWLTEKDRLLHKLRFFERECERYERDNKHLGKQVRHLLRCLEEERGTIIRRAADVCEYGQHQPTTVSDVIDRHLLTFESIEEMQLQNQKLLSLCKDLGEQDEARTAQIENADIKTLKDDLTSLKEQLETVKREREQIMTAFNTINKERDLFKILLSKTSDVEHMTPEIFQRMVSIACSSGPAITNGLEDTQDKDAHIASLKTMITKLEVEVENLKQDLEDTRRRTSEEIKLKSELLEKAHLKIIEESKQTDALNDRNQTLEDNIKTLTSEIDELRAKYQKVVFDKDQIEKGKDELQSALDEEKERRKTELTSILEEIHANRGIQEELEEFKSKCQKLELEMEHIERSKVELENNLEEEKHRRQTEFQAILDQMQANSQLRVEHDDLKLKYHTLLSAYEQLERAKKELESQAISVQTQGDTQIRAELDELRSRNQAMASQLELLQKTNAELENLLNSNQSQVNSALQSELNDLRSKHQINLSQLDQLTKTKVDLEAQIVQFQTLRNLEREARLELSVRFSKLESQLQSKGRTSTKTQSKLLRDEQKRQPSQQIQELAIQRPYLNDYHPRVEIEVVANELRADELPQQMLDSQQTFGVDLEPPHIQEHPFLSETPHQPQVDLGTQSTDQQFPIGSQVQEQQPIELDRDLQQQQQSTEIHQEIEFQQQQQLPPEIQQVIQPQQQPVEIPQDIQPQQHQQQKQTDTQQETQQQQQLSDIGEQSSGTIIKIKRRKIHDFTS